MAEEGLGGEELWGQHGGQVDDMSEKVASLNHQNHILYMRCLFFLHTFSHLSPRKKVVFNVEKHRPFYHGKNKNHLGW